MPRSRRYLVRRIVVLGYALTFGPRVPRAGECRPNRSSAWVNAWRCRAAPYRRRDCSRRPAASVRPSSGSRVEASGFLNVGTDRTASCGASPLVMVYSDAVVSILALAATTGAART